MVELQRGRVCSCSLHSRLVWKTLEKIHISTTVRAFDLILKLTARSLYQLSYGTRIPHVLLNKPLSKFTWFDIFIRKLAGTSIFYSGSLP